METYLAVYVGSADGRRRTDWNALDETRRQALEQQGMEAWGNWMAENQPRIVHAGGPVGTTKRVSRDGVADTSNELAGFVLLQAESHEAAARLFEDHPHFAIFPGDAVEVMPCLPIPGA
jgi:hypothetical protein